MTFAVVTLVVVTLGVATLGVVTLGVVTLVVVTLFVVTLVVVTLFTKLPYTAWNLFHNQNGQKHTTSIAPEFPIERWSSPFGFGMYDITLGLWQKIEEDPLRNGNKVRKSNSIFINSLMQNLNVWFFNRTQYFVIC